MSHNLEHECVSICHASHRLHMDKNAAKGANKVHLHIFSIHSLETTIAIVKIFCKWLSKSHPKCRHAEDITALMVWEFLLYRAAQGLRQKTLDNNRDRLCKLGKCIAARCHINFSLRVPRVLALTPGTSPRRGAQAFMPREDYDILRSYALQHPSGCAFVILLQNYLAGRVNDVCQRMQIVGTKVLMICKNGKKQYRDITPELAALLADPRFCIYIAPDGSFLLPAAGTVNAYLAYHQNKLGLARHSFHDTRRLLAQEYYDQQRRNGMLREEALDSVGLFLNHGPHRRALVLTSYVANPW